MGQEREEENGSASCFLGARVLGATGNKTYCTASRGFGLFFLRWIVRSSRVDLGGQEIRGIMIPGFSYYRRRVSRKGSERRKLYIMFTISSYEKEMQINHLRLHHPTIMPKMGRVQEESFYAKVRQNNRINISNSAELQQNNTQKE
jgi:hypothetical protein